MAATPEPGEPGKGKPFKLLGILDVENTPCARESILHGSLGSVVAGLGHFLLTSRIRRSCDVAVGGFILVTLGCWFLTIYPITVVLYLIIRNIPSVQHGSLQ